MPAGRWPPTMTPDQLAAAMAVTRIQERAVCLGMDALRLCLGKPTKNFTPAQVAQFIQRRAADAERRSGAP
jgi:hypothetical protein